METPRESLSTVTRLKRIARRTLNGIRTAGILVLSCFEAPAFLFRNRGLFQNEIIYVFFHHSFGHTVTGLDFGSRLYFPHRVSLIYLPHPRSNEFLTKCFQHNLDLYTYESLLPPQMGRIDDPKYTVLNFFTKLVAALLPRTVVVDLAAVYKAASIAEGELFYGNSETQTVERYPTDYTGYIRLLRDKVGRPPRLDTSLAAACRQEIQDHYPEFLKKPFVVLHLRAKGAGGRFDDYSRCSGPETNYVPAVKYLAAAGYHIVGCGETRHAAFASIPGYYHLDYEKFGVPRKLVELYLQTNCALFVGQQSGPLGLPNSCGIPVLICDAFPHHLGTFDRDNLIVFKPIIDARTERELPFSAIYGALDKLAYGIGFETGEFRLETSSAESILAGVKETLSLGSGDTKFSELERKCIADFHAMVPAKMAMKVRGNRPPIYDLKRHMENIL